MDKLDALAAALDQIDVKYGDTGRDRADPLWHKRVAEKDKVTHEIHKLIQTIPEPFPLTTYLISQSTGRQMVGLQRIQFTKDPAYLDLICYMLLNSTLTFFQTYVLQVLKELQNNCDYRQIIQIQQTLLQYQAPASTTRFEVKSQLLNQIKSMIVFSISEVTPKTYWWRDVESKFFNSLSGVEQYRISNLYVIRNERIFKQFENYRSTLGENPRVLFVYHGSSQESLRAIAENGFLEPEQIKKMKNDGSNSKKIQVLDDGYFGNGIYQGFSADYAILYAKKYKQSDEILLSAVLPGTSYNVKKGGEKYGKRCEPGCHSHISPDFKEIVLFETVQLLPLFIIRFVRLPNGPILEENY